MNEEELIQTIRHAKRNGVTELELSHENITKIPPEIGQLQNLTYLSLHRNEIDELPPEIGQLQNLTCLSLSKNYIGELPPEIGQLKSLTELNLSNNKIKILLPEIGQLRNLSSLYLYSNQIEELPPEFGQLQHLTELNLSGNQIGKLPCEIGQLQKLIYLNLDNNKIKKLLSEFRQLQKLSSLYLHRNQIEELPPEIGQLQNLTELNLSENQIGKLPSEIGQLQKLSSLYLHRNQIEELPPEIGQLQNLTELNLSENQIGKLPSEIGQLQKLSSLYLHRNQIEELPPEIGQLQNLTELNLSKNQIGKLPPEIGQLQKLSGLYLHRNQIEELPPEIEQLRKLSCLYLDNSFSLPPEIYEQKPLDQIKYILNLQLATNKELLLEAKMLLVGQGGVGKTSLANRLTEGKFSPNELRTEGIDIKKWELRLDNEEVKINIWDFGGQEIMHATHQFFLTKRSLYLLVWDARQEDKHGCIEYWLDTIKSFGGSSPVILVSSKIDDGFVVLDTKVLKQKYPNIEAFVNVSSKTGKGISNLVKIIKSEIKRLKHIRTEWTHSWLKVKSQLECMEEDFIDYSEYEKLCRSKEIKTDDAETLIRFLHDLGIVLNFRDDEDLCGTNVLKPEWVTKAVYSIINNKEIQDNRGIMNRILLDKTLSGKGYPRDKYRYITDIMKKFELCFGAGEKKFLLPQLLPKVEPEFE